MKKWVNEEKKKEYIQAVCKIISNLQRDDTAPHLTARINRLYQETFHERKDYSGQKRNYNRLLLEIEEEIYERVKEEGDSLLLALKLSRAGNYIDYGALAEVEEDKLKSLIREADEQKIEEEEYRAFRNDLERAGEFVLLADNAGEIVLDKILIRILREEYPKLRISVVVRGEETINDATLKDAKEIGMEAYARVIGNGTDIPGTELDQISEEARERIEKADLILSKGQGNFESIYGKGFNIYYAFLCKCQLFMERFQMRMFEGIFINEKNIKFRK